MLYIKRTKRKNRREQAPSSFRLNWSSCIKKWERSMHRICTAWRQSSLSIEMRTPVLSASGLSYVCSEWVDQCETVLFDWRKVFGKNGFFTLVIAVHATTVAVWHGSRESATKAIHGRITVEDIRTAADDVVTIEIDMGTSFQPWHKSFNDQRLDRRSTNQCILPCPPIKPSPFRSMPSLRSRPLTKKI